MVDAASPETLVSCFIADYARWNYEAHARSEKDGQGGGAMDAAKAAYWKMLADYVLDGTDIQPIAYGSESNHSPGAEVIENVEISEITAIVSTLYRHPKFDFLKSRYQYELVQQDGRWWITQVYFVDDDGRYPGL